MVVLLLLLSAHVAQQGSGIVGLLLATLYLLMVGSWWQVILARIMRLKKEWTSLLLGMGVSVIFLGLVSSVSIVWYRFTAVEMTGAFGVVAAFSYGLAGVAQRLRPARPIQGPPRHRIDRNLLFRLPRIISLVYIALLLTLWILMVNSTSREVLESPWTALHPWILPLFFVATLLLGLLLLSRTKSRTLLACIVLHSFVLHAYLPLSHEMPWGGDVWRMIGVEERLSAGEEQPPVLFGEQVEWQHVGGVSVPAVLTRPHKYIYGQLWGLSVLAEKLFSADMITVNRWLLPVLWSLLLPLFFYRIGCMLFRSQRYGLFFAGLSLVPFTFQALGGLTLATSLGFLTFCAAVMFWLAYREQHHPVAQWIVWAFAVLLLFGHPLYVLSFWGLLAISLLSRVFATLPRYGRVAAWTGLLVVVPFGFPILELASGVNWVPAQLDWFHNLKQAVGQLSGWFFSEMIRPHDILPGNILFNHTPHIAFVPSLFLSWRWHMMLAMAILGVGLIVAAWQLIAQKEKDETWWILGTFALMIGGGYVISWYVLDGDRSFTRRMDPLLAWIFLLALLYACVTFFSRWQLGISTRGIRALLLLAVCFVSWTATTAYASGPDMRVVSSSEYTVAETLWSMNPRPQCVLGDTWMLLALEGVSHAELIAGGYPLGRQYAQPERLQVLDEVYLNPTTSTVARIDAAAPLGHVCTVALEDRRLDPEKVPLLTELLGADAQQVADMTIWKRGTSEQLNTSSEYGTMNQ